MAYKMLRPYRLLFYLLSICFGFSLGLGYASWIEAGKGQMLAAAAIVLGYGFMGALFGLLSSLWIAYKKGRPLIFYLNIGISILLVLIWLSFSLRPS